MAESEESQGQQSEVLIARTPEEATPLLEGEAFEALAAKLSGLRPEQLKEWLSLMGNEDDSSPGNQSDDDELSEVPATQKLIAPPVQTSDARKNKSSKVFHGWQVDVESASNPTYAKAAQVTLHRLAEVVLNEELATYSTLGKEEGGGFLLATARRILFSCPPSIIRAALSGDIAHAYCNDLQTRQDLDLLLRKQDQQPVIYVQTFCDRRGRSPLLEQWERALDDVESYGVGDDWELNLKLDQYRFASRTNTAKAKAGLRCYAEGKDAKHLNDMIKRFVSRARAELRRIGGGKVRLSYNEVGYARDVRNRFKQHRSHRSSNLLMNLVEAALHRHFGDQYSLCQFVVYQIWSPEQAAVAEIIFSRLFSAYTEGGRGFNTYPAGRSNASAFKVNHETWDELATRAIAQSPLQATYEHVGSKLDSRNSQWTGRLSDCQKLKELHGELVEVDKTVNELRDNLAEAEEADGEEIWDGDSEQAATSLLFGL